MHTSQTETWWQNGEKQIREGPRLGKSCQIWKRHKSSGIILREEVEILVLETKVLTDMTVVVKVAGFVVVNLIF